MDLGERRELMNGFGNTFSVAVEFVATPMILAGLGYLLDRWLGTRPLLTVGLAVFGVIGMFLRTWLAYAQRMDAEEKRAPWTKA